jgi:hypothetical protein
VTLRCARILANHTVRFCAGDRMCRSRVGSADRTDRAISSRF